MIPDSTAVPGLAGWPEWAVALVLTAGWCLNASLTVSAARAVGLLAAAELALLTWLMLATGWRADSGMVWLWSTVATSLAAGTVLPLWFRVRLGAPVHLDLRRFWAIAWPLAALVLAANAAIAGLRFYLGEALRWGTTY